MLQRWTSPTHRRWAFWLCVLAVLVLALMPPTRLVPATGWDKANHAIAFALLAVLGCLSYPARVAQVVVGLLAYGALIEVLQTLTGYRTGEWLDLAADGIGVLLGWRLAVRFATEKPPAAGLPQGVGNSGALDTPAEETSVSMPAFLPRPLRKRKRARPGGKEQG